MIGGQGLVAQMQALAPDHVDDLVEAYRVHNDPLHDTLEAFDDVLALLPRLRADGRTLGIVTAKRHRTVALAVERFPALGENFSVVVAHEDTDRHKPDPDPVLAAADRLGAERLGRGVRRRLAVRHPRREGGGCVRRRRRLGRDPSRRGSARRRAERVRP